MSLKYVSLALNTFFSLVLSSPVVDFNNSKEPDHPGTTEFLRCDIALPKISFLMKSHVAPKLI